MSSTSPETLAPAVPAPARHYGMDWLRIGAFGFLILYHVGLVFSPWGYEVKSSHPFDWVALPLLALNAWRLSLLFAISGYASAALFARERGPGSFARSRLARLGIPLLFGMLLWVTPQPWVALVTQHGYREGFGHFLRHDYFGFKMIDGIAMPTWMHLWFVVYLLVYALLMAALLKLPGGVRSAVRRLGERGLAGPGLLVLPVLYVYAVRQLPHGWSDTHSLVDDPAAHAVYFAMFLFGWLLRGSEPLRLAIARQWKLAAVLALLAYAGVAAAELAYPGKTPLPPSLAQPFRFTRAVQCWATIVALFGLADHSWNRDGAWRATLAEAVFPFYIIHQTIILVVGYLLLGSGVPAPGEFLILTVTTAGGCWLFYLAGRGIGPLRPLIGLKRRATAPEQPPTCPPPTA